MNSRPLILICLLLLICLTGCQQSADSMVRQGDASFNNGDFPGAMKLYRRAYRQNPENPLVRQRIKQLGPTIGINPKRSKKPDLPHQ